ncbi:hypothetical protein ACJMK2_009385, partial [Sinanodonta woodiana]
KMRSIKFDDVDEATLKWFKNVRAKNIPVDGPRIQQQAEKFAKDLGHETWKALHG